MIPGSVRSPGGGNGNPLQYPCRENPMDRGAWRGCSPRGRKNRARLSDSHGRTYCLLRRVNCTWCKCWLGSENKPRERRGESLRLGLGCFAVSHWPGALRTPWLPVRASFGERPSLDSIIRTPSVSAGCLELTARLRVWVCGPRGCLNARHDLKRGRDGLGVLTVCTKHVPRRLRGLGELAGGYGSHSLLCEGHT